MRKTKVQDECENEKDKRTYVLPEATQCSLDIKASEMGISSEDLLTLIVAIGLNEKTDLRELFISQTIKRLEEEYKELTSLKVGDIVLHFNRVDIKDNIDLDNNEFLITIDYYLDDAKVATRIERPLENVTSITNALNVYEVGLFKK